MVNVRHLAQVLLVKLRKRTLLGMSLMLAQAFLYNAIFFSYALILTKFHGVKSDRVGLYVVPFAIGNFAGPLLLGPLFDKLGRRVMIPATYALSAILLMTTGLLFLGGYLDAITQTVAWAVVFFFASAAASSAYLTVSELFPVELRGMAIALFFAFGTLVGSVAPDRVRPDRRQWQPGAARHRLRRRVGAHARRRDRRARARRRCRGQVLSKISPRFRRYAMLQRR